MPMIAAFVIALSLAQPDLLDRTVAIVGGQPITLSDVRAAIELRLIEDSDGSVADVTSRLVDRALILREVQRYAPSAPEESAVEAKMDEIRQQMARPMTVVLEAHGFDEARLRSWLRDDLRANSYLAQRFASASTPSDAEVAAAYTRQRAQFEKAGLTFEQVSPIVRESLVELRRRELVVDWLADLRRRTDVVIVAQ
jgi:hypothetical protein